MKFFSFIANLLFPTPRYLREAKRELDDIDEQRRFWWNQWDRTMDAIEAALQRGDQQESERLYASLEVIELRLRVEVTQRLNRYSQTYGRRIRK